MARFLLLVTGVLAVGLCAAACSSEDEATAVRRRCEQVRDHLIDLRLSTVTAVPADSLAAHIPQASTRGAVPEPDVPIDLAAHRAAMKQALGEGFLSACLKLDRSQIDCALSATDDQAAAACGTRTASK